MSEEKELAMRDLARRYPKEFPNTAEKLKTENLDNLPEGVKETLISRGIIKGEQY